MSIVVLYPWATQKLVSLRQKCCMVPMLKYAEVSNKKYKNILFNTRKPCFSSCLKKYFVNCSSFSLGDQKFILCSSKVLPGSNVKICSIARPQCESSLPTNITCKYLFLESLLIPYEQSSYWILLRLFELCNI